MQTKPETKRRWREANPDKVAEQIARRKARRAAMSESEKEAYQAKKREALKRYRESIKGDADRQKKIRENARRNYRLRKGLAPDAPLMKQGQKYTTAEERRLAHLESKRRARARKLGMTLEEYNLHIAQREAGFIENKQLRAEDAAKRAQRNAEARAAAERAKRRANPAVLKEMPPKAANPVNANDPPELIELFRKANKGQPPVPYNPRVRKLSVFHFRGAR